MNADCTKTLEAITENKEKQRKHYGKQRLTSTCYRFILSPTEGLFTALTSSLPRALLSEAQLRSVLSVTECDECYRRLLWNHSSMRSDQS